MNGNQNSPLSVGQRAAAKYVEILGPRGGELFANGTPLDEAVEIVTAELNEKIRRNQETIDRLLSSNDVIPPELSKSGGGAELFGQS